MLIISIIILFNLGKKSALFFGKLFVYFVLLLLLVRTEGESQ